MLLGIVTLIWVKLNSRETAKAAPQGNWMWVDRVEASISQAFIASGLLWLFAHGEWHRTMLLTLCFENNLVFVFSVVLERTTRCISSQEFLIAFFWKCRFRNPAESIWRRKWAFETSIFHSTLKRNCYEVSGGNFQVLLVLVRFYPCIINEMTKNTEIKVEHNKRQSTKQNLDISFRSFHRIASPQCTCTV